ncbi:MAG: AsmA family protein [Alphaproteobacteria bacterium]|nr:AsmA family protein [Alphaproteobacteria bacterium]
MSRRARFFGIFGGLFATLIVAVIAAVLLFDWNVFRAAVELRASLALGRPVTISDLQVRFIDRELLRQDPWSFEWARYAIVSAHGIVVSDPAEMSSDSSTPIVAATKAKAVKSEPPTGDPSLVHQPVSPTMQSVDPTAVPVPTPAVMPPTELAAAKATREKAAADKAAADRVAAGARAKTGSETSGKTQAANTAQATKPAPAGQATSRQGQIAQGQAGNAPAAQGQMTIGQPTTAPSPTAKNPTPQVEPGHTSEIERVVARVDMFKAWYGGISIPEIIIDRPRTRLERKPSGASNFYFEPPSGNGDGMGAGVHIGQLTINDGRLRYINPMTKTDVDVAVHTAPDPKGGLSQIVFDGGGRHGGVPTRINVRGGSLLSLREAQVKKYPVNLQWQVGETRIRLTGTLEDPLTFAGLDAVLEISGPDLAKLYDILGIALPPSAPYRLTGHVVYYANHVWFERFDGTLGSSDLSGTLTVRTGGPRLRLDGDLKSRKMVLADLAGFIGTPPSEAKAPTADGKALPTDPVNVEKLNSMDAHVKYRAQRLETENLPLDDLSAVLDLENGRFRLTPLAFGIGEGQIETKVDMNARVAPPQIAIEAEFRNVDLHRIMQQTKIFEGAGKVGGRAKLVSTGTSAAEVMAHADGGMTLAMSGGQIDAILIELAGIDLLEAAGIKLTDKDKKFGIRCMIADRDIKQGVFTTKTFVFDTEDTNILGGGSIDFRDETLNFRLEPHPKDMSFLTFRTPVNITGSLIRPSVTPDAVLTGGRIAAMIGLGVLLTPLGALIPTIELGLGADSDCAALLAQAQRDGRQVSPDAAPPPQRPRSKATASKPGAAPPAPGTKPPPGTQTKAPPRSQPTPAAPSPAPSNLGLSPPAPSPVPPRPNPQGDVVDRP